jgi:lipid II:glycine glycyltransferase (peptidoglycan interpeptide bridge formation enzyme)
MSLEIVRDGAAWDALLRQGHAHVLQTYGWGELKSRFGWYAERVTQRTREGAPAAAQILYRHLAPVLTLAYIPRGPLCADPERLPVFLEALRRHARARGVFALKLEPDWLRGDARDDVLRHAGAVSSADTIQPPVTMQVDLTADPATLLGRMHSKWRYNIRLAEKKGIRVRAGGASDLPAFYALMQLTGERDHFAIHSADYYRAAFALLEARDSARLFVAEWDNKPLAMIFLTGFGDEAIYLYGASGNEERNRMPNHALHWAGIQWAKERGCTRYDLWGVPEDAGGEDGDANLPSTLYRFKQGFGGKVVRYSGAWDVVLNRPLYALYRLARRVRQRNLADQ